MAVPAERLAELGIPMPGRGNHLEDTPTNEFGIALPPLTARCLGDLCLFKATGEDRCSLTLHHLHSTGDTYFMHGSVADKFRNLPALTAWLYECRHNIHHEVHNIEVPVPNIEIMRQGIRESRILRRIRSVNNQINSAELRLEQAGLTLKQVYGLEGEREELFEDKDELLPRVDDIEVIPAELVTGSLLLSSPEKAQQRLFSGTGFALTGFLSKEQIPMALAVANEVIELIDEQPIAL